MFAFSGPNLYVLIDGVVETWVVIEDRVMWVEPEVVGEVGFSQLQKLGSAMAGAGSNRRFPVKDKRSSEKTHRSNLGIGFFGPMVSMIPAEAIVAILNLIALKSR
ncbi:hypothetical protein L1887_33931 [Cichorium endivia]|nr:hypothetical protein L1887_33931 [Cichorium endivia]